MDDGKAEDILPAIAPVPKIEDLTELQGRDWAIVICRREGVLCGALDLKIIGGAEDVRLKLIGYMCVDFLAISVLL